MFAQGQLGSLKLLEVNVVVIVAFGGCSRADVGPVDAFIVMVGALSDIVFVAGDALLRLLALAFGGRGAGGEAGLRHEVILFVALQHRVLEQETLNLLVQLQRQQLQQLDRLLQLRGERKVLREFELETGLHPGPRGGNAPRDRPRELCRWR